MEEAEKYYWRQNIVKSREGKDFLDVTAEDFSKNKSVSIDGNEITPSSK
jgi:hypothetical protein